MNISDEVNAIINFNGNYAEKLYFVLSTPTYNTSEYEKRDLGENITLISSVICGYWKPRYVVNHTTKCAYEFMDANESLKMVQYTDIDWLSIRSLPDDCKYRARVYYAGFPTYIYNFQNGVAEVEWQLQPDGRYWMDEDGFGMTPDERISIYGFIDTSCKVVIPFQAISSQEQLDMLRSKAEEIVKNRKI